jgi:hypothetical protein
MTAEQGELVVTGEGFTVEKRGLFALIWGMIARPRRTLEFLREHKSRGWLWIALLSMLLAVLLIAVSAPISARLSQEQIRQQFEARGENLGEIPPEAQARAMQFASNPLFTLVIPALGGVAVLWIAWLVWAGALHLVGTMVGGNNSFGQMFRAVVWSWVPLLLRSMLQVVYVVATGELIKNPGLSGLASGPEPVPGEFVAPPGTGQLALQSLLGQIDLFQIWNFILLVIVVIATARLSRRKAFVITLVVWILFALVRMLPALVTGMVAGSLSGID